MAVKPCAILLSNCQLPNSGINDDGRLYDSTNKVYTATIQPIVQKQDDWSINTDNLSIGGVAYRSSNWEGIPGAGGSCTVVYNPATQIVKIIWSGGSSGSGESSGDSGDTNTAAAHETDYKTAKSIGDKVLPLVQLYQGNGKSLHVTLKIDRTGTCTVASISHSPGSNHNNGLTDKIIYKTLIDSGFIDQNHKVALQANDIEYTITVKDNDSNNDNKVNVDPPLKQ